MLPFLLFQVLNQTRSQIRTAQHRICKAPLQGEMMVMATLTIPRLRVRSGLLLILSKAAGMKDGTGLID